MSDGTPLPNRTAETPISGRNYPDDDPESRRWSEIWRAAVEELNANALVSDLATNRLDYSPEDGTLFIPSDGGDWYLGNGTGWDNLGPIGNIGDHVSDATNPHSVTSDQVGSPSDTEFTSHTGDMMNPHSVTAAQADALPTSGGTMTGDVTFGEAAVETISGTGATLSFTGTDSRDIHDVTDVSFSNSSGASVTEDVTLNYYQGVDNTGTLVESQTKSVTLADAASTTVQFLTADFALDNVDYFLEVTTTALTVDSIDEIVMGASYVTEQTSTGDLVTTDQNSRERARYDATSGTVTFPTVNTDGISNERSFRLGRTVYFNPANRGPYTDGQNAFADVPPGGQFIIAAGTDYDIATEGRLVMDAGKTIRGEGWTADTNRNISGSTIVNSGADVVDQSVIEFSSTEREERGIAIYDLAIIHEGSTSPAIYIDNSIRNVIADCAIELDHAGQKGIETAGQSFFTRIYRTNVQRYTQYGLHIKGSTGGGGGIIDCHVSSSATDSVATRVERQGIRISGGQHSSNGAGISFYNTDDTATRRGSYVDGHIWFELCDDAIRIDGNTNPYNNVVIVNPRTSLDPAGSGVNNLLNLGRAHDVTLLYPTIFRAGSGGNLATLGANTARPKFIGDYTSVGVPPVVDNGAEMPTKFIQEALSDAYLTNINTSIPVWVALRRSTAGNWSPVFNDGTDWFTQESANVIFTP